MELVTPGIGLIFWMTLSFGLVLFILRKFAWRPILSTIKEREAYIAGSIRDSKRIQRELAELDTTKEKLLVQAREKADELLQQAKREGEIVINKAQQQAREEASKIIEAAKNSIHAERKAAEREIRKQIVNLTVDMTRRVLQDEFSDVGKNNQYVEKLLEDIQLN
ncbi:MAG: F0F1 ATP synthase subunit B [Bacteroidales bacterium]|nr:F0F1 ATP synthase subunit B [Bacteroidales bacterium]